jgi:hypothetical protein
MQFRDIDIFTIAIVMLSRGCIDQVSTPGLHLGRGMRNEGDRHGDAGCDAGERR